MHTFTSTPILVKLLASRGIKTGYALSLAFPYRPTSCQFWITGRTLTPYHVYKDLVTHFSLTPHESSTLFSALCADALIRRMQTAMVNVDFCGPLVREAQAFLEDK